MDYNQSNNANYYPYNNNNNGYPGKNPSGDGVGFNNDPRYPKVVNYSDRDFHDGGNIAYDNYPPYNSSNSNHNGYGDSSYKSPTTYPSSPVYSHTSVNQNHLAYKTSPINSSYPNYQANPPSPNSPRGYPPSPNSTRGYPPSSNLPRGYQPSSNSPEGYLQSPNSPEGYIQSPSSPEGHSPGYGESGIQNHSYSDLSAPPSRQVPYDYTNDAASKEMSSSTEYTKHSPTGPKPPTDYNKRGSNVYSTHSNAAFADAHENKKAKPGGIMKCLCCGGQSSCWKVCGIVCCILILLIIAVVAAVLLWARPPDVQFLGIEKSPNSLLPYVPGPDGFDFNFGLLIQVNNPNIVGATFSMIKAVAFYPGFTEHPIGGGNKTDVKISANGNTTINFPFSINYVKDIDPGFKILLDIAKKCGLTGGAKSKIDIEYTLTLSLKVLLITVSPSFNRTQPIDCPIQDGKIPSIPGFNITKATQEFSN